MTPDEIRAHPYFQKLTEKRQKFVNALLANGNDKVKAAHEAWACKTDESARTIANKELKRDDIAYLVAQYFGTDPDREEFTREGALAFAASRARGSKDDKLALDYFKLIVQMNGWLVAPAKNDPAKPPADDGNEEFTL